MVYPKSLFRKKSPEKLRLIDRDLKTESSPNGKFVPETLASGEKVVVGKEGFVSYCKRRIKESIGTR